MAETGLIRTPDQRVRVFVSSALQELAAERRAVRDAITGLRLVPVMFELGARPHPPRNVYRAYLAQSQVFVGIYRQSYGWVAPGEPVSGLEDEYQMSAGMPRLIYVKSPAPDIQARLAEMLDRIKDSGDVSYQRFSDPEELQSLVQNDLAVLLSERFEMAHARAGQAQEALASALPVPATPLVGREREAEAASEQSPATPGTSQASATTCSGWRPWPASGTIPTAPSACWPPRMRCCRPRAPAGCWPTRRRRRPTMTPCPDCAAGWEMQRSSRPGTRAPPWDASVPWSTRCRNDD
jgi:hypothetical protein